MAGCFRLRHSGGFFGDPIWLLVNSGPALPPYAGDAGVGAAAATLEPEETMAAEEDVEEEPPEDLRRVDPPCPAQMQVRAF